MDFVHDFKNPSCLFSWSIKERKKERKNQPPPNFLCEYSETRHGKPPSWWSTHRCDASICLTQITSVTQALKTLTQEVTTCGTGRPVCSPNSASARGTSSIVSCDT